MMAIPRYATLRAVKRLYANVQIMLKGGLSGMVTKPGGMCPGGRLSGGNMSVGHLSGGMSYKRYKRQNLAYYSTEY